MDLEPYFGNGELQKLAKALENSPSIAKVALATLLDTMTDPKKVRTVQTFSSSTSLIWDISQCIVVQIPMEYPMPRNWEAIWHVVVCYAWTAHAFSALIKRRHCISSYLFLLFRFYLAL